MNITLNDKICPCCLWTVDGIECAHCGYEFADAPRSLRQMIESPRSFSNKNGYNDVNLERLLSMVVKLALKEKTKDTKDKR